VKGLHTILAHQIFLFILSYVFILASYSIWFWFCNGKNGNGSLIFSLNYQKLDLRGKKSACHAVAAIRIHLCQTFNLSLVNHACSYCSCKISPLQHLLRRIFLTFFQENLTIFQKNLKRISKKFKSE
jgi:hypothetical protein